MSDLLKELAKYPDPMSKTQFCRACHISNTTGEYLIESGLVPSTTVGKSQWFVLVTKEDICKYIERRQMDRRYYQKPTTDPAQHQRMQLAFSPLQALDFTVDSPRKLKAWVVKQFRPLPDVLHPADVSALLGYHEHTVSRWCTEKRIPCTIYHNKALIAKKDLINFISSEGFNAINRKSELHYKIIFSFRNSEDLAEWREVIPGIRFCST